VNRLMLVAASGLAREVLASERALGRFAGISVVDDNPALWGASLDGEQIIGGLELVTEHPDHLLLVCAGRGSARRAIVERLGGLGVGAHRYVTSVHPRVEVPTGCTVGRGSILLEGVVLTTSVRIGTHVVVMPHVTLTHDDLVEDYATLCAGVSLGGAVRVGPAAYLGMNASVREGVTIGADGTLGMGAALLQELPPGQAWVGVPARPMAVASLIGEA
jgi:sugar O-acyltransferase (sialic acid O-acetyltransferase NeuD family)